MRINFLFILKETFCFRNEFSILIMSLANLRNLSLQRYADLIYNDSEQCYGEYTSE